MKNSSLEELNNLVLKNCNSHGRGKYCPERISNAIHRVGYRKVSEIIDELMLRLGIEDSSTDSNECRDVLSKEFIRKTVEDMKKEFKCNE